ncbi:hypothetical protein BL250_05140 [Erwinia sp. OLTSP20]|uniref:efflux RND transporter periplasmic adaptor subunit n=1 Tax=unclassified Erwinia TaxID=2622719 RepID=UPI000C18F24A|nr:MULTISPECIES: efflux RND transporter periplasmic adaptor subunit [unclassified Erwinia]PIJ50952.1 hypothetical protein BV501_06470 [Erwinia sp. OAMSP11]PIJ75920.1 hypothetical protein BK416_00045 [Erwinia sp. OLSSP12]PIJ83634.1 hypothetical protein BLD47_04290 [Erwinia sp. OLCASP19]PIJ89038.1 hypothetical protein BLD49_00660 [Erwinia sp. OLMDSP33]PIJ93848.1 hypothetical protein BL250_05140 [Erwinia sp. OLTSP20]
MSAQRKWVIVTALVSACAVLSACDKKEAPAAVTAPQVAVQVITPQQVIISDILSGRVTAPRRAEIRPQVSGIIQHRLFTQGSDIRRGTPLFQINTAPFKADKDSAAATLLRMQAAWEKARQQRVRLLPLMQSQAVSRQRYDDAVFSEKQAAAEVAQAQATLARKQLDLSFATVTAPISGRIDEALVSEGAYVTASDNMPLARIYQTDPLYVDVRQPAAVYDELRQQLAEQQQPQPLLPVTIFQANGTPYPQPGRILFSGLSVDAGTGEVLIRIEVENPQSVLLPGMFVRVKIPRRCYEQALLVPQQAVQRTAEKTTLWLINENQQATRVAVDLAESMGDQYRIQHGLTAGARVVVQGAQKLKEGTVVSVVPWTMPAGPAIKTTGSD